MQAEEVAFKTGAQQNGVKVIKASSISENGYSHGRTYPYKSLKEIDELPSDVDPSCKESYLSDQEFATVFGMDREAYKELPGWKRHNMKKNLGLF
jgi:hypothetical protein